MVLCTTGYCADINWSLDGTASGSVSSGTALGTPSNIKDDNTSTYYGVNSFGGSLPVATYTATVTFAESADLLTSVNVTHAVQILGIPRGVAMTVDLFYSGSWNTIINVSFPTYNGTTQTNSATGNWTDVTAIRYNFTGGASANIIFPNPIIDHRTYELRAFGPVNSTGNQIITFI